MKRLGYTWIAILLVPAGPALAQMYKCTNERGVVQYTDKPSAGCKEVDIRPSPPIWSSPSATSTTG